MNSQLTAALRNFTQEAKTLLSKEIKEQLEGIYGLLPGGKLESSGSYPAINSHLQAKETRQSIELYLENERNAGLNQNQAYEKLVKEAVFTWLNRFLAFKLMETRKLLRQTISRGVKSNAFLLWLTEKGNESEYEKYEQGDFPQDYLGQGPRQQSYRHFLVITCKRLSEQANILFNPETLISQLLPRPRILEQLIHMLDDEVLSEVWEPGNDETIGWVYQYFIQDEKEAVFDKIYKQKKKIEPRDLPAATQIFTPRWIVRYLVENTLGRLWLRMHPDSELREKMKYYVPNDQDRNVVPLKQVIEITLLDPACGTMHFGMTAFDLFYEMYLEEIKNQGKPGWPGNPAVVNREDIPQAIVENNIYGIDIDLRAIQLSALSLYLKAGSKEKNARLSRYRLTCTDIHMLTGDMIRDFVDQLQTGHRVSKKLLLEMLPLLNKAHYLGSLLKVEEVMEHFVEKERAAFENLPQPVLFEEFKTGSQKQLDLYYEKGIDWEKVSRELVSALEKFGSIHPHTSGAFLAGESVKGVNLIDALIKKHDVVVSNPPYSGRRNWSSVLSEDLKTYYDKKSGDLYTCFIDRCIDLTQEQGFTGMITVHSFMFTSSHEAVRKKILEEATIETMAHLGTRSFDDLSNPNAQGFVMYSLGKSTRKSNDKSSGVYFRLVKELNILEKEAAFLKGLTVLKNSKTSKNSNFYILSQEKLKVIPSWPFVYWVTNQIYKMFDELTSLDSISKPYTGLSTGDNFRYLRLWWEIGKNLINFNCKSSFDTTYLKEKWFPCMKGGSVNKWFGNQDYIVNWGKNGHEIKNTYNDNGRLSSRPQNQKFYFNKCITYTYLTISDLNSRYVPPGYICDHAGNGIFCYSEEDIFYLLGILNSKISAFFLNLLNPTVHKEVGDIAKILLPKYVSLKQKKEIGINVEKCVSKKQKLLQSDEISWEFISPPNYYNGYYDRIYSENELAMFETEITRITYSVFELFKSDLEIIEAEFGKLPGDMVQKDNLTEQESEYLRKLYLEKHVPSEVLTMEMEAGNNGENTDIINNSGTKKRGQKRFLSLEEICLAAALHPETVYHFIVENHLEREEERADLAFQWISYAVGIVMGRFKPGIENALGRGDFPEETAKKLRDMIDPDAIMVMDEGHSDDLPLKVRQALETMAGEKDTIDIIKKATGKQGPVTELLRQFLENTFFKRHIQQYRKRPVYWFLQSPKKKYGVWLFHERINKDTPFRIRSEYVEPKKNLLDNQIIELKNKLENSVGREKRDLEKTIENLMDTRQDIREFHRLLDYIINERGYIPHIDDGVLLNIAPLWELVPSWQKEPKNAWEELKEGKYDWAFQAMDHWPERVKEKCKTDKSLAIAHGLD